MIALFLALLLVQSVSSDKAIVEGIVVNALTGEPLRKAAVTLEAGDKTYAVISSSNGKFRFEGAEQGHYLIHVERQGFLDDDDEPWLAVSSGQAIRDLVLKLTPEGIIAGHVVDEDGDPVAGADVIAERSLQVGGRKVRLHSSSETANSEGYFFISGLKPGRYRLSAAPPDDNQPSEQPADSAPRQGLVHTEYPLPIQLAPGQASRDVEIKLQKSAVFRVRGRVPNPPGDNVSLNLSSETDGYTARLERDGSFAFESVAPGDYELTLLDWPGRSKPATLFCRVPVTVSDGDVDGVVAELIPGPSIEGTIKTEGDGHFEKPPVLHLLGTFPPQSVIANEDGTFAWTNLAPKKYSLDYGLPDGYYTKSIQFNHQPLDEGWIDLNSGAGGTLEILLAPRAAAISVTVDGKRGIVTLWSDSLHMSLAVTDDTPITFSHLAPGEYRILAWEKIEDAYTRVPEFLAHFDAQKIKVAEGAHENIAVKLIPKSVTDAEITKLQ